MGTMKWLLEGGGERELVHKSGGLVGKERETGKGLPLNLRLVDSDC